MIEIKNLNLTYNKNAANEFTALKNIDLNITNRELVILKGVSGSGKSTLLSIIAALIKPTSGEIKVDGKYIAKLPDLHASLYRLNDIGFIFQSFNLFENLSVEENIALALIPLKLNQKEVDKKVSHALTLANIIHKKNQSVKNLSGGEKQRTAIARALVNNPKIILCDEPTANLDRINSLAFIEVLKELKKLEKTIVVATHDPLFESLDFVDRIIDIKDGEIL